tara:strand:- start:547 stop:939 length:393 start_codon:yes stop_codon:yes gene_type:complete
LDFGDDIELVGAKITGKEINYVSEITGLTFPNDTEPLGYYFLGSGIDRALVLKVMIADDQKEEVFKNEIFEKGNDTKSNHTIAKQQEWWKVDELTDRIDRKMELPKAEYLECTVGLEDGKTYVYVTWFEI